MAWRSRGDAALTEVAHFSVGLEPDEADWYPAVCDCGWKGGLFPTAEDACDALMDHALAMGSKDSPNLRSAIQHVIDDSPGTPETVKGYLRGVLRGETA